MNKHSVALLVHAYLEKYPRDLNAQKVLHFMDAYEQFWQRENQCGHLTASAWVVDTTQMKVLLTHHKKLDMWVQLGGHIEAEDKDIYAACVRELKEESGFTNLELVSKAIFDIDVHTIPISNAGFPAHSHYDIRFLFQGDSSQTPIFDTKESHHVTWVDMNKISNYSNENSVKRMVNKTLIQFFNA